MCPLIYLPALGSFVNVFDADVFRIFLRCTRLFLAPEEPMAPFNLFSSKYINFKSDWMKVIVDHLKYMTTTTTTKTAATQQRRWRWRLSVCGCMSRLKVESPISLIVMDENIPRIFKLRCSFFAFILCFGQLNWMWRFFRKFSAFNVASTDLSKNEEQIVKSRFCFSKK